MSGKQAFCCFMLIAIAGCSAATRYDSGAIVLEMSEPGAFTFSQDTTPEFSGAFEAIEAENYTRAEALLEAALAENPRDPYALLAMGSVHERTGRFSTATGFYRSADRYGSTASGPQLINFDKTAKDPSLTVSEVARENLAMLFRKGMLPR